MDYISVFDGILQKKLERDPEEARRFLAFGYRAYRRLGRIFPDRRLPESKRFAADVVMRLMIKVLTKPEETCMASLFVPGEPLAAAGILPYSVEAFSSYLTGTHIEKLFLDRTSEDGVPETMCSFHRIFDGAAASGLMPKPPFMVYTNLACDGNMMTFPYLKELYKVPAFYIDVPWDRNEDAVAYVADQLHRMVEFVSDNAHRKITEEALREAVSREAQAAADYREHLRYQRERCLPGTMTSDMYGVFLSRILAGTHDTASYTAGLLRDISREPATDALRVAWIHLMPFMQPSLRKLFSFSDRIYLTANDIVYDAFRPFRSTDPYEAMAARMVYSAFNGKTEARIDCAEQMVRDTNAEGVILFAHWGCRTTIGASGLIRDTLEERGIPTLILEADGCNPANSPDGQLMTRVEAFMEMLEEKRRQGGEMR